MTSKLKLNIFNILNESVGKNNSETKQGVFDSKNAKDKINENITNAINSRSNMKISKQAAMREYKILVEKAINHSPDRDRILELRKQIQSNNTSMGNYTRSINKNKKDGQTVNKTNVSLTAAKRSLDVNDTINANGSKEIVPKLYEPKNARRGELRK